jgi:hypothetical protein
MNSEKNNRVIRTSLRNLYRLNAIHLAGLILVDPGILTIDIRTVCLKFTRDFDNFRIPHIRAIFLEGKAKDKHLCIHDLNLLIMDAHFSVEILTPIRHKCYHLQTSGVVMSGARDEREA